MIRQSILVLLALAAPTSFVDAAQPQQPTAANPTKKAAPDPDERICKDIDVSGVRLEIKHVCATRAEWQARQQGDREAVERMQRPFQCSMMGTRKC